MTVLIGKIEFQGPYYSSSEIEPRPGLFALLCDDNDEYELLEIGQSDSVDSCLDNTEFVDNLVFYEDNCTGRICAAVHYTDDLISKERTQLRDELLGELNDEDAFSVDGWFCVEEFAARKPHQPV